MNKKIKAPLIVAISVIVFIGLISIALAASNVATKMSLQGRVTSGGSPVDDKDLRITVSTQSSCTTDLVFNQTYSNKVQDGVFDILMGNSTEMFLEYNKDYWLCTFVDEEQVGDPYPFRGGQGEIGGEDIASNLNLTNVTASRYNSGPCQTYWNGSCLNTMCSGSLIQSIGCT